MSQETTEVKEKTEDLKQAKTVEMTPEEFRSAEREIQLSLRDTLPGGRSISEVHQAQIAEQKRQEDEIAEIYGNKKPVEETEERAHEVSVFDNGSMSVRPAAAAVPDVDANQENDGDGNSDESDIPLDVPARDALIAGGVTTLEQLGKLGIEELIVIKGIKQPTAEKILNYFGK